ncbi:hypothetical protein OAT67_09625, partial [Bacteriovoracaceae bacterium]|nr:hypothetical protein [Bacteriovoracaceae bacterium]
MVLVIDQNPIGLGPGRTGGAVSLAKSVIMKDPVYGIKSTWTFDNLFISLAIDLGWGMIFYLLIITIFPLFLIYKCIYFYFNKQKADITPILLSALTTVVLLAGDWGVIGIPYNPESFSFWFWTSIGITQIY